MTRDSLDHVLIRRLWLADREAFRDHLVRLDPDTRRNRFVSAMSDTAVEAYAERAIRAEGVIFGAFVEGVLRGVAELRPMNVRSERQAEAAFSVEGAFRRKGIGTALFERLALTARNRSTRRLHVRCLPHNRAMQALARKGGAQVVIDGYEAEGHICLELPTPFSVWRESLSALADLGVSALSATWRNPPASAGALR